MANITFRVQGAAQTFTWSAKWKRVPGLGEQVVIGDYPSLHAVVDEIAWSPSGRHVSVRLDARQMGAAELEEYERRWQQEAEA